MIIFKKCLRLVAVLLYLSFLLSAASLAEDPAFRIENGVLKEYLGAEENVVIPDNVETIAMNAFRDKPIKTVSFPESLKAIESGAFSGSGLTTVTLPDGVLLGGGVFSGSALNSVYFEGNVFELPVPPDEDDDEAPKENDAVAVGNTVCAIPTQTFNHCENLSIVSLPPELRKIGSWAFGNCTALKSIDIPDGVTELGNSAFSGAGLTELYIPGSMRKFGQGTFQNCESLVDIILEKGITSISNASFSGCVGLKRLTLPESMEYFESAGIFNGADNLVVIKFLNRNPKFTRPDDFFGGYEPIKSEKIDPTVYGYKGTQLEQMAYDAGLDFVSLDEVDGETIKDEEKFESLDSVKIPTILVSRDQNGELTFEQEKNNGKNNTIVYNVHLRNEFDGKPITLDKESILCFPYPEGLNENSLNKYRIIIHHYAGNRKTEVFKSENGDIEFTRQGLCIRVSSFSPFEINWEIGGQDLPQTGDRSSLGLLFMLLGAAFLGLQAMRGRKLEN